MTRQPKTPDPLAHHLARRHINRAQFLAAKEYRKHHHSGESDQLARCHAELGADGSALVRAMLIEGLSAKQVAGARGLKGQQWPQYLARRYFEALGTLAEVMGYANGGQQKQRRGIETGRPSAAAEAELDRLLSEHTP